MTASAVDWVRHSGPLNETPSNCQREIAMLGRRFVVGAAVLVLSASQCFAGEGGADKYTGVVIFDRWGGCMLNSGIYVMYISETVKAKLKNLAGKCIEVDAIEIEKGDVDDEDDQIKKLTVLGPAPPAEAWVSAEGLKLVVAPAFEDGHAPEFTIRVENVSQKPIALDMDLLGPTVLGKQVHEHFSPSPDGPSEAIVTRQSFWTRPGDKPRLKSKGENWAWTVTQPLTYEERTTIQPEKAFEARISLELPAGEYEFLVGYGGSFDNGRCIASKLIAFDVKADGSASLAKVKGR
jgi:hypothetical protein